VRRDAKAVDALAKLLDNSDPVVARAAARAMGKIGTAEAAKTLQAALPKVSAENRLDFCEGLFRCAESLAASDQKDQAVAIYDELSKLDSPHQVRGGALRAALLTPFAVPSVRGNAITVDRIARGLAASGLDKVRHEVDAGIEPDDAGVSFGADGFDQTVGERLHGLSYCAIPGRAF
jgi:hypothetical protein